MAEQPKVILQARNLTKTYGEGETCVTAVDRMDFSFYQGEFVVILGESGAGKSTLLNLIGGIDAPTKGLLVVNGANIAGYNKKQRTLYRRNEIGFVFQFYNLMPNLTARENIEIATQMCPSPLSPEDALAMVGLSEQLDKFPAQLSGGEQQRVSIARAIAKNSSIILCDEPTGALDYENSKQILALLEKQAHENGKTVVVVTHNSSIAEMADRLLRVRSGKIVLDVRNAFPKSIDEIEW